MLQKLRTVIIVFLEVGAFENGGGEHPEKTVKEFPFRETESLLPVKLLDRVQDAEPAFRGGHIRTGLQKQT
jgi:hypothetical protein